MGFDVKALGPLAGSLINAGAPSLGAMLTLALTPEVGPMVAGWIVGGA